MKPTQNLSNKATMSGEKIGASMASLATGTTTPASSTLGVKVSAGKLATTSSQALSATFFPPPTPSLNTAEAAISSPSGASSPLFKFSSNTAEATKSDPTTASPPQLTPFPDLNCQTATLLARLKNPSLLSTEELQSATAAASATLSAWKKELLNIEANKRRKRGLKPTTHVGIRHRNANTVEEEKERSCEDWNDGEEALPCAQKKTVPKTNQAPSATGEPPTGGSSSAAEETSTEKDKADSAAKHSAKMREVWAKRRAEGTSGWSGGEPLQRTAARWKKMAEKGPVDGDTQVGEE